jgi:hypothetical protein
VTTGVRISELPVAQPLAGGEVLPIVQSGETRMLPVSALQGGGVSRLQLEAGAQVLAYRVVTTDPLGFGIHASSGIAAHVDQVIGLALQSAAPGAFFEVAESGLVTNPGWNWTPGQPLFLGLDGQVVPAPVGNFTMQVGYAKTDKQVYVRIGRGILKNG